jgi:hypothetical protein
MLIVLQTIVSKTPDSLSDGSMRTDTPDSLSASSSMGTATWIIIIVIIVALGIFAMVIVNAVIVIAWRRKTKTGM